MANSENLKRVNSVHGKPQANILRGSYRQSLNGISQMEVVVVEMVRFQTASIPYLIYRLYKFQCGANGVASTQQLIRSHRHTIDYSSD